MKIRTRQHRCIQDHGRHIQTCVQEEFFVSLCVGSVNAIMTSFFDSFNQHIHLYINILNTAWKVGTLLITHMWLALIHLRSFSHILNASLNASGSFFILVLLHHRWAVYRSSICLYITCTNITFACRHICLCIHFAKVTLHIIIIIIVITYILPDDVMMWPKYFTLLTTFNTWSIRKEGKFCFWSSLVLALKDYSPLYSQSYTFYPFSMIIYLHIDQDRWHNTTLWDPIGHWKGCRNAITPSNLHCLTWIPDPIKHEETPQIWKTTRKKY